jgi:hypothetical protein
MRSAKKRLTAASRGPSRTQMLGGCSGTPGRCSVATHAPLRLAGVVGDALAGFAEQPPPAQLAEHEGPQQIAPPGLGMGVISPRPAAGPLPIGGHRSGSVEQLPW